MSVLVNIWFQYCRWLWMCVCGRYVLSPGFELSHRTSEGELERCLCCCASSWVAEFPISMALSPPVGSLKATMLKVTFCAGLFLLFLHTCNWNKKTAPFFTSFYSNLQIASILLFFGGRRGGGGLSLNFLSVWGVGLIRNLDPEIFGPKMLCMKFWCWIPSINIFWTAGAFVTNFGDAVTALADIINVLKTWFAIFKVKATVKFNSSKHDCPVQWINCWPFCQTWYFKLCYGKRSGLLLTGY